MHFRFVAVLAALALMVLTIVPAFASTGYAIGG